MKPRIHGEFRHPRNTPLVLRRRVRAQARDGRPPAPTPEASMSPQSAFFQALTVCHATRIAGNMERSKRGPCSGQLPAQVGGTRTGRCRGIWGRHPSGQPQPAGTGPEDPWHRSAHEKGAEAGLHQDAELGQRACAGGRGGARVCPGVRGDRAELPLRLVDPGGPCVCRCEDPPSKHVFLKCNTQCSIWTFLHGQLRSVRHVRLVANPASRTLSLLTTETRRLSREGPTALPPALVAARPLSVSMNVAALSGIPPPLSLRDGLVSLSTRTSRFIHVEASVRICFLFFFLRLTDSIRLCAHTAFCLSIPRSADIWMAASTFGPLGTMPL